MIDDGHNEALFYQGLFNDGVGGFEPKYSKFSNCLHRHWGISDFSLTNFFDGRALRNYSIVEHLAAVLASQERLLRTETFRYLPTEQSTDRKTPVSLEAAVCEIANGSTLLSKNVESCLPISRLLLEFLCREIKHPHSVASFVSFSSGPNLHPHKDDVDIFAVQVIGAKRWKLWSGDVDAAKVSPKKDLVLNPGCLLYLPSGHTHFVEDISEVSVSLNVYVKPMRFFDVFGSDANYKDRSESVLSPNLIELKDIASILNIHQDSSYAAKIGSLVDLFERKR